MMDTVGEEDGDGRSRGGVGAPSRETGKKKIHLLVN